MLEAEEVKTLVRLNADPHPIVFAAHLNSLKEFALLEFESLEFANAAITLLDGNVLGMIIIIIIIIERTIVHYNEVLFLYHP